MKNMVLKNKLVIVFILALLCLAFALFFFKQDNKVESISSMDFSQPKVNSTTRKGQNTKRKIVKIPDPAYKAAPEFEDFQVISKMYIHSMAPFKNDMIEYGTRKLSLRDQSERVDLLAGAAKSAKYEAELYKSRLEGNRYKRASEKYSDVLVVDDNDNTQLQFESVDNNKNEIRKDTEFVIRLILYTRGNKFTASAANFSFDGNEYSNIKQGQVFGSRFALVELDDELLCAKIKDLTLNKYKKICRG